MVISIDVEKLFDKIQHPFMIKTLYKLDIKGTFLKIIKAIYYKPTANIILNGEKMKAFTFRSGTRQGYSLPALLFRIVVEVLARADGRRKKERASKLEASMSNYPSLQMALYMEKPKHSTEKQLELTSQFG